MGDWATTKEKERAVQKVGPPTMKIPEMQILNDGEDLFSHSPYDVRVYKKRWIALAVYFLHITFINWLWFSYSSVPDVITCYYRVNVEWVNALSWAIMAMYVVGVVPAMWILQHVNLKLIAVVSALLNALGAWIRFAGTNTEYFWVIFVSSVIISVPNLLEWTAPTLLSSLWFPSNERAFSTATTAAIAPQVGALIGLFLSPIVLSNPSTDTVCNGTLAPLDHQNATPSHEFTLWQQDITHKLYYLHVIQAVVGTILIPITFLMKGRPPVPPSISEGSKQESNTNFFVTVLLAFKNPYFVLFLIVGGIFIGGHDAVITVYDEILLSLEYDYDEEVAYLGMGIQVASILALVVVGVFIDITKTFFFSTMLVCLATSLLITVLQILLQLHLPFIGVCIIFVLVVGAMVGFEAIGYEYAVEMTYPLPEVVSTGYLNCLSQVFSLVMVVVIGAVATSSIATYSCWFFVALFILGTGIMIFVQPELRRVKLEAEPRTVCFITCYQTRRTKKLT